MQLRGWGGYAVGTQPPSGLDAPPTPVLVLATNSVSSHDHKALLIFVSRSTLSPWEPGATSQVIFEVRTLALLRESSRDTVAALQMHGAPMLVMCATAIGGLLKSGLWNQHRKKDGMSTDLRGCGYLPQTARMEPPLAA